MKYILYGLIFCFLSSCMTVVHFSEPQPKKGQHLDSFPLEIQGSWKRKSGEMVITTDSCMTFESFEFDSLGTLINIEIDSVFLSDSLRLYKAGDYFVYNLYYEPHFVIAVVEKDDEGNWNHYYCDDPHVYKNMRGLKTDSARIMYSDYNHVTDDFKVVDTTLTKPKKHIVFENPYFELQAIYFKGQIRTKDLKNLCTEEYLLFSLRRDGTYYEREDEDD